MFKKEEIKKYIDDLGLSKEDYIIIAGGSLTMHGLKEITEDIDLDVSNSGFEFLKTKYNVTRSTKPYPNLYTVNDDLEVILQEDLNKIQSVDIEGYRCTTVEEEYEWKKSHGREKDRAIIEVMEQYLANK